jgi:DNA mismatch repair ATPase MutS
MLSTVGNLSRIVPPSKISELDTLLNLRDLAAALNKKIFWLCFDEAQAGVLAAAVFGFLNFFGLSKLIAFIRIIDSLTKSRDKIRLMFESIGSLDASIAAASWIQSLPLSTVPSFNSTGKIEVEGIYHPLIKKAVGNSFHLQNKSALITGSNMAGKTTFIKTIGLNVILARTLFVCLAERADLPRWIVRSSIRLDEKVIDGQSYYSREIEQIREFLNCPDNCFLFLIDEIFRGTNTIERIAISAATLQHLSRRNMALVTTHDVELQALLADCSRLFHFSEQVNCDKYYFDFILRDGPCRAGNAIKLIELKGYPSNLVDEARRLAAANQ